MTKNLQQAERLHNHIVSEHSGCLRRQPAIVAGRASKTFLVLYPIALPIPDRGCVILSFECPAEVVLIRKTGLLADFCNLKIRGSQQYFCHGKPLQIDIIFDPDSKFRVKYAVQGTFANRKLLTKRFHTKIGRKVLVNILQDLLQERSCFLQNDMFGPDVLDQHLNDLSGTGDLLLSEKFHVSVICPKQSGIGVQILHMVEDLTEGGLCFSAYKHLSEDQEADRNAVVKHGKGSVGQPRVTGMRNRTFLFQTFPHQLPVGFSAPFRSARK